MKQWLNIVITIVLVAMLDSCASDQPATTTTTTKKTTTIQQPGPPPAQQISAGPMRGPM